VATKSPFVRVKILGNFQSWRRPRRLAPEKEMNGVQQQKAKMDMNGYKLDQSVPRPVQDLYRHRQHCQCWSPVRTLAEASLPICRVKQRSTVSVPSICSMISPFAGPPPDAAYLAESRVPQILFGTIFPAAIATIFVLARFYSRAILMKNWGWDDTWILFSWVCCSSSLMHLALVY
jgi:hypothetical protein